jgi:NAD(P)-dependent dehydrogenase (short-subunit alcohol dehydrogenase family)
VSGGRQALQDIGRRFSLEGKVALVTGAGRGLGRVFSLALAAAGADVVVAARTEDELRSLVREVRALGRAGLARPLDVADVASIRDAVGETVDRLGRLDVLVNNAGTSVRRPALEIDEDEWDRVVDTNLKGAFFCAQAAGRVMVRQRAGKIINVASALAFVASNDLAVYCTTKAAVVQMTRALALEWAPSQVNVNAIAPTTTRTPMMEARLADPAIHESYVRHIPMGRVGAPDDLIGALLFLAGPASDFVTGQTVVVDGGFTAH